MARIPAAELERLKREIAVERLAAARGIELRPHGANLIGLCPFHDDHEPSLVITPAKNLWHCLGACQTGGSVIDWMMKAEGLSFRHAVERLRSDLLPLRPSSGHALAAAPEHTAERTTTLSFDADDRALLKQVVAYYHDTLKQSPEALAYLQSRGLGSAEMIERFQLGFANRTLGYRLPPAGAGAEVRSRLQALGIVRESGHEHFNGCVVIPIFDEHGNVSEIYGRKITRGLRAGTALHLYLPGPHRGVWNREALQASQEIILCEALIDALTFWCAGFRNVTSSYGVEGFTDDHLEAFQQHGTERVLIAYDRDDAGEKAAAKLAAKLQAFSPSTGLRTGIGCFRVELPKDLDANEYALKHALSGVEGVRPATHSLALLLRTAHWLGQGPAPVITSVPAAIAIEIDNDSADHAAKGKDAEARPEPALSPVEGPDAERPTETLTPLVAVSSNDIPIEIRNDEIILHLGDRKYRVRGLGKNLSYDALRVNVLAARAEAFHVDTLDLYSARQRALFIRQAAEDLALKEDVIKKDLGKVLLKLEELQDEQIRNTLEPQQRSVNLSDEERTAARDLLSDPKLLDRILCDFERCGVVGEETNKLVGYLAAVSRKLNEPLAVVIQSSSAAGKSSLMDAILAFMPEEERVKYSAMTGQSLFYMGETNLKHKILAIVEEAGAERASYALKLLQSEGELTIASTGKDPETGKLVTHEYRVEGPVMIFLTTTAIEIDEELLNRCLVLTVNEDREQTRAIHRLQRERQTLEGLLARQDRNDILNLHQNAQRLLKPHLVANPYAKELTFLDTQTRTRRDHMKYLTLIRTIALLHQYQRPLQMVTHQGKSIEYIEVSRDDIATANRLAHDVLGRSLDELAPHTRSLLQAIDCMVSDGCRRLAVERCDFRLSRRDIREHTNLGNTQLKHHLHRLEELEYLLVHRGGRGQSFVYELLYNGEGHDGRPFLIQLINPNDLPDALGNYDAKKSGVEAPKAGASRPQVGAKSVGGRSQQTHSKPLADRGYSDCASDTHENAQWGTAQAVASYVVADPTNSASPLAAAKP
jgi:DNA primase catalytic core